MLNISKIVTALANNALELLSGLTVVIMITRSYSAEEAGAWFLFTNIVFFLSKIREGFTQIALVKSASTNTWSGVKASWLVNTALELVFGLACCLIASYVTGIMGELLYVYPLFAMAWAWYRWGIFVLQSQLMTQQQFKVQATYLVIVLVILGYALTSSIELPLLACYLGVATALAAFVAWYYVKAWRLWKVSISKQDWEHMRYYGWHGLVREAAGTLSARSSIFFTASFLSLSETAILGVAQRYAQLILMPNAAIQSICFAYACRLNHQNEDRQQIAKLLSSAVIGLWVLFLGVLLLEVVYGEWLLTLLHGETYATAWPLLLILSVTTALFAPIGNAFGSLVNVLEMPSLGSRLVLHNSIINILLTGIAAYSIGLYGIVAAPFITEAIGSLFIIRILKNRLQLSAYVVLQQGFRRLLTQLSNIQYPKFLTQ